MSFLKNLMSKIKDKLKTLFKKKNRGINGGSTVFKYEGINITSRVVLDKVSNKVELREPLKFIKYSGCVEDIEKLLSSFNARVGEDEEGYTYKLIHLDGDAKLITHEDCGFEFILNNYILYTDEGLVCILSEEEFNKLFKRVL